MNEDYNKQTAGANFKEEELTSAETLSTEGTISEKNNKGDDHYGLSHIPEVLKSMEGQFAFTAVLVSIIGYIVISAFGQMSDFKKYIYYILFLAIAFVFYKLTKKDMTLDQNLLKNRDITKWILFILCVILFGIVVFDHRTQIANLITFL